MAHDPVSEPRISVIVPVWNGSASIEAAVRSVLDQGDVDLECIVVDDGSTDDTPAIVAGLARSDARLVSLRLPVNEGVSAARNRALSVARGEWLAFLDADDVLLPGALSTMRAMGDSTEARVVVGQRISSDGVRTWFPVSYDIPDIRRAGIKSVATNPGLLYYVGPAGKLFHREVTKGVRFEGRMLGDQPWIIEALLRAGNRIAVVEDVVYEWRRPRDDNDFSTITASRVRSARLATEAARIAADVYRRVSVLIDAYVAAELRHGLRVIYAERLIRADLKAQLVAALERGDSELAGLFDQLATFLSSIPTDVVRSIGVVEPSLLAPAAAWLGTFPPPARDAFWSLLQTASRIRAGADSRADGWTRRGLRGIMALPVPLQRPLAEPPLRVAGVLVRRRRAGRHPR